MTTPVRLRRWRHLRTTDLCLYFSSKEIISGQDLYLAVHLYINTSDTPDSRRHYKVMLTKHVLFINLMLSK